MQRVNPFQFYQIGVVVGPLTRITTDTPLLQVLGPILGSFNWLDTLLNDQIVPIVTSRAAGWRLYNLLNDYMTNRAGSDDLDAAIGKTAGSIANAASNFQTVFAAEMETQDVYFVSQKGIYSTRHLIESADALFPQPIRSSLPANAVTDIQQAGKCLAFGLATSAGFHIMRATESVLLSYYGVMTGKSLPARVRNWGLYIKNLRGSKADPKTLAVLDQVREHHRNPIMHPEIVLSDDEVLGLLGVAQSAIMAMIREMQKATSVAAVPAP